MRLSRKAEIQPTPTQGQTLLQHAGNARWAYNWGLRQHREAYRKRVGEGKPKKWKGWRARCPRFKSRSRGIGGFRLTGTIKLDRRSIQLPRIGRVKLQPGERGYLPLGKHAQVSVTQRVGRWYVSVLGPEVEEAALNGKSAAGLDLGAARLATLSDGTVHGKVVLEDLNVRNMTRKGRGKRGLNRVVLDAAFGEFRRFLEYKGKLYGCEVVAVPPHFTSQRCSACGTVEKGNRVSQAEFRCLSCGYEINADLNAAINILAAGSCPDAQNACGGDASHQYFGADAAACEAGTKAGTVA